MKKIFIFAALMLGLASCQNDNNIFGVNVNTNEEAVEFTITATAPEVVETRAANTNSALGGYSNEAHKADGKTLRFILEIYDANEVRSAEILKKYVEDGNVATFNPRLIPGREYTFVVWADVVDETAKADVYYNTGNLREVTLIDGAWKPMDEARDAYTGAKTVTIVANQANSIDIPLTRPFGKLRIITTDVTAMNNLNGIRPTTAKVTYTGVPMYKFDAFTQTYTANGTSAKTHEAFTIVNYTSNTTAEMAIYTDYFFAPVDQVGLNAFTIDVYDQHGAAIGAPIVFPTDIPVARNTLTTVKGNLLTTGDTSMVITATVNDDFTGKDETKDTADDEIERAL